MPDTITLSITQGNLKGRQFVFDSRTTCIVGRSRECNPQLPDDEAHSTISRFHCLLDINPPNIRIRDFGSKNGTYVNGKKIGQREKHQTPEEGAKLKFPEYDLSTGDRIQLGDTVFTVEIQSELSEPQSIPNNFNFNFLESLEGLLGLAEKGEENLQTIKGYSLVKLLGKGGCGEVYLAKHRQSGNYVALKLMLPSVAVYEWAVEMFFREMANTKALNHPNVVKLIDYYFSQSEGVFFFTMEYCSGGTVADLLGKYQGKIPIDIAIAIILQILDGLDYTHNAEIPYVKLADGSVGKGKGLVHRDLKPSNLFLTEVEGKVMVKIGDYGLAKAFDLAGLSGQSMTGGKAGTPAFMCRQQLLNFKYAQPEVDVWAVAACLYSMLTGYFPREFQEGQDPFLVVLQNEPIPIRKRDASIPRELAEIIDLALKDKSEIYFKSAAQFKKELIDAVKRIYKNETVSVEKNI